MSANCHAKEGVTSYSKHRQGMPGNIRACQEVLECDNTFPSCANMRQIVPRHAKC